MNRLFYIFTLVACATLFNLPVFAWALPTFDTQSETIDFSVTGTSHSHTVGGACSNRIIIVSVASYVGGGANVTAATIGGVGATQISELVAEDRRLELWYRKGVSIGSNTIAITMDTTVDSINTSSRSYCGVDQTTPLGTPTATADPGNGQPSIAVASSVGDLVIDAIVSRVDAAISLTVDGSQNERYNEFNQSGTHFIHAESDKSGTASTTTMSWTQTGGDDTWYMIGVALLPSAGAASLGAQSACANAMKSLLLILFLLVATSAQATIYWAHPSGSGATCGTTGAADPLSGYTTLAKGITCLSAGDTLNLKGGTYTSSNGVVANSGTDFSSGAITVKNAFGETARFSGTHPIDFYASPVHHWIIDGSDGDSTRCSVGDCTSRIVYDGTLGASGVVTSLSSYVRWKGVEIKNVSENGWQPGTALPASGQATGMELINSRVHHNGHLIISGTPQEHGLYNNGKDVIIDGNDIYSNCGSGIHAYTATPGYEHINDNMIIRNNRVRNNGTCGISAANVITAGTNIRIYNNLIHNNTGAGISMYYNSSGAQVYGNIVYSNGSFGLYVHPSDGNPPTSTIWRNNISQSNTDGNINFTATGTTIFSSNLCSTSAQTGCIGTLESPTTTFNDPANANFTLKAGSVAINGGTTLASPYNTDILAVARPQGAAFDIGAYEASVSVVTITGPTSSATYDTSLATITVSGTSDLSSGSVTWSCDRCTPSTGTATGTTSWTTSLLTLKAGINILTITATTGGGASSTDTLTITYAPTFPGNSLALAMAFENGSGSTVTDLSGSGNTGTLVGSPTWLGTSGGRYGNAVQFDGVGGQYMTVADANSLDFTQSLTISMWVKPSVSISNYSSLVAKVAIPLGPPYRLFAGVLGQCGTGGISGFVRSNGASGPENQACHATPLAPNVWAHVAFTYDGANLRLYKNGALMTTTAHTGYIEPSTGILYVARSEFGEYFAGAIDELRIYNFAIPSTTTNNATFGAACSSAEEIATPSVVGDANCPIVPLAPPVAFKVSATSTIKLGADKTQKIGGTPP